MITLQQINVPAEFRSHQIKNYPQDNFEPFEEWFGANYDESRNKSDRAYLPIYWTSFYGNNRHGREKRSMKRLQFFLDHHIDRSKKYFTICQNDDSILNNISHLDIKVFGMGCKSSEGTAQLPLVCQPHKYEFKETGRPIFASFIGSITHPIRQKLVDELQGKEGYFISTEPTSLHSYCYIMSQSQHVLAPRGYGATSFRIMEALQYGAIPVYWTEDDQLFGKGCLTAGEFYAFKDKWSEGQVKHSKMIFEQHYAYSAVANRIYENL
jgi:hypothetical protein